MNEDILRFEVTVNQMLAVQVLDAKDDLSSIELGQPQIKLLSALYQLVELPSINKVHHKIERPRILLQAAHVYDERMVQLLL